MPELFAALISGSWCLFVLAHCHGVNTLEESQAIVNVINCSFPSMASQNVSSRKKGQWSKLHIPV